MDDLGVLTDREFMSVSVDGVNRQLELEKSYQNKHDLEYNYQKTILDLLDIVGGKI